MGRLDDASMCSQGFPNIFMILEFCFTHTCSAPIFDKIKFMQNTSITILDIFK